MSAPQLPSPPPGVTPDTSVFWAATLDGKLLLQRCADCGLAGYYPRYVCANCHHTNLAYIEASGRGSIYSHTVTTRGILEYADAGSYVLAMVELNEGPKMLTNIIGCDPTELSIGQPVEVVFCATGGDGALPRFRPVTPEP
ncbi:Zn-ribbon domain-containing OB-fold protein [Mycolicibacterium sp. ELW1]|jgi:uncharacterized OB-fold protein|uniref:Zn-ribbon domain-containing OB-fold protein n=1 Tax=Mycobacteriaceae TaxID=1762 RepID=UPI0011EFBAD0|nr:OB-fold domain-containing protein [Mycobacterium sp. ELW1]QEN16395.1 nucleotide-binding protein [Mycobacterium sp. ELW1]